MVCCLDSLNSGSGARDLKSTIVNRSAARELDIRNHHLNRSFALLLIRSKQIRPAADLSGGRLVQSKLDTEIAEPGYEPVEARRTQRVPVGLRRGVHIVDCVRDALGYGKFHCIEVVPECPVYDQCMTGDHGLQRGVQISRDGKVTAV